MYDYGTEYAWDGVLRYGDSQGVGIMANLTWLIRRLKAMSIPEVGWRVSQKMIQKKEQSQFKSNKTAVSSTLFHKQLSGVHLDADRMMLNWDNASYRFSTGIPILGGYDYETYKNRWNAGFQTENAWPDEFSYFLAYKQRDDIGDARTNWELNRHFQFALLAKAYYASGNAQYLNEFKDLFYDWNKANPFLWGISWTSVMEVAIRCSNWCYAWAFLKKANADEKILDALEIGILNMTDYVANHYSRFSSANNHLIVEAYAIGQTGVLCDYAPWIKLALEILTRELPLQNYSDGVNKELSLHYQSFYMEAMGLMMRLLKKNDIHVPDAWAPMLEKMCTYVADCMGDYGEVIVFGDDDEGKLLDLEGGEIDRYQYVLSVMSCLLSQRYVSSIDSETVRWLFTEEEQDNTMRKERYISPLCCCYKEGGNTILRSTDRRVLLGIDHAALGYGSIAAHGHADALSFQMYVDGEPVFVDPGTYIYHCDLESRNAFRRTENHNTVCVDGKDQSEMLGAFLWGKKAKCKLIDFLEDDNQVVLKAEHNGYAPILHSRCFIFDKNRMIRIQDVVRGDKTKHINFLFAPGTYIHASETVRFQCGEVEGTLEFSGDVQAVEKVTKRYAAAYGRSEQIQAISVISDGTIVETVIKLD